MKFTRVSMAHQAKLALMRKQSPAGGKVRPAVVSLENGEWFDSNVTRSRLAMIKLLTDRLNRQGNKTLRKMDTVVFARKLEAHLFSKAASFEDYQDESTLDTRFRSILAALLRRRIEKAEAAGSAVSTSRRLQVLAASMGMETVQRLFVLVRQIELMRLGKPATAVEELSSVSSSSASATSGSSDKSRSSRTSFQFHFSGQEPMPKAARDIFFGTTIVEAFYNVPVNRLGDMPWTELVQQAQKAIREYHHWLSESK